VGQESTARGRLGQRESRLRVCPSRPARQRGQLSASLRDRRTCRKLSRLRSNECRSFRRMTQCRARPHA
jgi:hypothetical protein